MASHPELSVEQAAATLGKLAESFLASQIVAQPGASRVQKGNKLDFETQYKALVERIPAVVFVAPLEVGSGVAYVSPQIETILGFTQDEWLGDPLRWYQQVHPDDKHRWSVEAASLFASGEPLSSNYRVLARDGRVVWFQCDARMVHSEDGSPSFIHGIAFDVSELKETELSLKKAHEELEARVAERTRELAETNERLKAEIEEHRRAERELIAAKEVAEQAARMKGEFLANMSHEIRTPMNGVLGLTHLVLAGDLADEQREYLATAYSSAESLLGIINQVLDFSKLESGKAVLDRVDFEFRQSLENLRKELNYLANEKGLELVCEIDDGVPERLRGDLGRLRQVLTNLIGNAIKFTHKGSVKLMVGVSQQDRKSSPLRRVLQFAVADTGIGIPPAKMAAIFEPFMQADGSVTRQYGGTGLGLALTKNLVELMGGQIFVTSTPGEGSTFSFTACFEDAPAAAKVRATGTEQHHRRSLSILVAEDNPVNQKVVMRLMQKQGHTVTLAQNGREAFEAIQKTNFDLILMDVQMPVMDGLSATQAIRAFEAESKTARLPIIAVTAHAMEDDRRRCLESGMDAFLSKPVKVDELVALVDQLGKADRVAIFDRLL